MSVKSINEVIMGKTNRDGKKKLCNFNVHRCRESNLKCHANINFALECIRGNICMTKQCLIFYNWKHNRDF